MFYYLGFIFFAFFLVFNIVLTNKESKNYLITYEEEDNLTINNSNSEKKEEIEEEEVEEDEASE